VFFPPRVCGSPPSRPQRVSRPQVGLRPLSTPSFGHGPIFPTWFVRDFFLRRPLGDVSLYASSGVPLPRSPAPHALPPRPGFRKLPRFPSAFLFSTCPPPGTFRPAVAHLRAPPQLSWPAVATGPMFHCGPRVAHARSVLTTGVGNVPLGSS